MNPADNPFLHDRKETFQPKDLWEWLLRFAIIAFVFDVGIRRIQIDRDEWAKAWAKVREYVFFWQGRVRPAQADESLAALLARRDQVRARTTVEEPSPDLFRPATTPAIPQSSPQTAESSAPESTPDEPAAEQKPASTTSRLLEAKRRAQKRSE